MNASDFQISVVIPAWNREHYVAAAVRSVLEQTLPPLEILVVDDGSTDGTAEVVRAFGGSVRCLAQPNRGAAEARNHGARAACGNWLAFLDSDDLWVPHKLELQAAAVRGLPEDALVFGHMEEFPSPEWQPADGLKVDTRPMPALAASALLLRRAAFERVGPFDPTLRAAEFIEWHGRASDLGCPSHVLPEVVLRRRVHAGNLVRDQARLHHHTARALKAVLDRRRAAGTAAP